MSSIGGVSNDTQTRIEAKLDHLSRQVATLSELVSSQHTPATKCTLMVEELAERWSLCPEAVRRLVRDKQLRSLRDFRPYRFTLKEVLDFENNDAPRMRGLGSKRKGGRK
ncbi:helix-turn-helix domain-containing protein [Ruficoccus amylovorans]|uniref:Helix-turn-helix domain-containing protein n=1 Tax=Ruficoccus amylovorans TaxID=1804625 RepID=A0A842HBB2_9BACT|nr:helix-turn-helix domain-containing protein [Ruficoccus amylovorans]MBC2593753.1 helix-turn-helix domain-containing protein [Ruficoccus amylovorans]